LIRDRVPARAVVIFVAVALALAWAVALPLYFTGGLGNPLTQLVAVGMMATPAIAAVLVVRFVDRPQSIPRELGLWPLRPARRLFAYLAFAVVIPAVIVLSALPIGAWLGVYPADITEFSAFREAFEAQAGGLPLPIPIGVLVALQFVNVVIGGIVNTIPALGEELGWRGYLLPKLMPLGAIPAVLISGVTWGLWHAPLLLLGYNYPSAPGWIAVLMMCGMCILIGAVFGWLRLRSNSVWPPALAHGVFNATAGLSLVFARAGEPIDTVHATVLGWTGWIVPLVLVATLLATRSLRRERPACIASAPGVRPANIQIREYSPRQGSSIP
jgi:membrane protease YdiL (CAAX protease family)